MIYYSTIFLLLMTPLNLHAEPSENIVSTRIKSLETSLQVYQYLNEEVKKITKNYDQTTEVELKKLIELYNILIDHTKKEGKPIINDAYYQLKQDWFVDCIFENLKDYNSIKYSDKTDNQQPDTNYDDSQQNENKNYNNYKESAPPSQSTYKDEENRKNDKELNEISVSDIMLYYNINRKISGIFEKHSSNRIYKTSTNKIYYKSISVFLRQATINLLNKKFKAILIISNKYIREILGIKSIFGETRNEISVLGQIYLNSNNSFILQIISANYSNNDRRAMMDKSLSLAISRIFEQTFDLAINDIEIMLEENSLKLQCDLKN